jgi:hypothetical protein
MAFARWDLVSIICIRFVEKRALMARNFSGTETGAAYFPFSAGQEQEISAPASAIFSADLFYIINII